MGLLLFGFVKPISASTQGNDECRFIQPIVGGSPNGDFTFDEKTPFEENHTGLDYIYPAETPVVAVEAGEVVFTGWWPPEGASEGYGFGYSVFVKHDDCSGILTFYSHLDENIPVVQGEQVFQGQLLGYIGETGSAPAQNIADLHFGFSPTGDPTKGYAWGGSWLNPNAFFSESAPAEVVAEPPKQEYIQVNVDLDASFVTMITGSVFVALLAIASILVLAVIWKRAAFVLGVLIAFTDIMFVVVVIGPPPYELRKPPLQASEVTVVSQETRLEDSMVEWAQQKGIGVKNLEANILASSICWSVSRPGFVAAEDEDCRKVDLLLLLGIDNTETIDADVEWYDPTKPGPMGWEAVEITAYRRWGYEGGLEQLRIIWQIMMQPEMRTRYPGAVIDVNANGVYEPNIGDHINVYGSSATCIGRSQGLPTSIVLFANSLITDPNFTFDPWNDTLSSALFKAAHLANDYEGTDVWERRKNAAMGYNPNQAQLEWMLTLNRIQELSDIPSENPTLTVITSTRVEGGETQKLFYVLYSKDVERTPLETMIEWSIVKRAYYAEKWDQSSEQDGQTLTSLLALWAELERSACNVSLGFAARPCKQGKN